MSQASDQLPDSWFLHTLPQRLPGQPGFLLPAKRQCKVSGSRFWLEGDRAVHLQQLWENAPTLFVMPITFIVITTKETDPCLQEGKGLFSSRCDQKVSIFGCLAPRQMALAFRELHEDKEKAAAVNCFQLNSSLRQTKRQTGLCLLILPSTEQLQELNLWRWHFGFSFGVRNASNVPLLNNLFSRVGNVSCISTRIIW